MCTVLSVVNQVSIVLTAIATLAAAAAAFLAYQFQKRVERNRIQSIKLETAVSHLQELMVAFAEIRTIAENEHVDDRINLTKKHADKLRKKITIVGSLHPECGKLLELWYSSKETNGDCISQIIHYELAQLGGYTGMKKYNEFFKRKSRGLREAQDLLFAEISA